MTSIKYRDQGGAEKRGYDLRVQENRAESGEQSRVRGTDQRQENRAESGEQSRGRTIEQSQGNRAEAGK